MMAQGTPTEPPERTGTSCPTCGAAAERGQLVCLECGSRITLAYRRPPSWKVPVAITVVVVLLAGAGAALAFQAIDDDAEREVSSTPANPKESAPAPTEDRTEEEEPRTQPEPAATEEEPDTATEPEPEPDPEPPSTDEDPSADEPPEPATDGLVREGGLYTWPRSLRSFTVVLLSAEDRASASSFARSASESSPAKIGVIRSNDFQTLPKGFFVVFAGEYANRAQADRAAARLGGRFPGAFAQLVQR